MSVLMMVGTPRLDNEALAILGSKTTKRKRTIVVGLKSHNCSREMLLRLLTLVVLPGDTVLAIHVQESVDTFDPNSFHIHEDLCKSKQVNFFLKVCTGGSFIAALTQQVILHFASILVLGCSSPRPKESVVSCLQDLPQTCFLLVMNNSRCILLQQNEAPQYMPMNRSLSSHNSYANDDHHLPKALPVLSTSRSLPTNAGIGLKKVMNTMQILNTKIQKQFQQVASLESMGASRRFTQHELERATDKFSPLMVIGHSSHSIVYKANLKDGQVAAVKVLKITNLSREELLQEVNILSGLNHENIVHLIGYCYSKDMQAVVYNLLQGSLKQNLKGLQWTERMNVAVANHAKAI
ncbi:LEAF RUST 10 DISEASE-RESISTANCE LOCUS RECEPTOR-LIKE PROTEIN KINASE-like 2.2 [Thalictrum thalictroides]|uniref:LEAF RUST 10 DISEASE-RESISTANCE LOCUS RECEPTOR-LIKE PROTEIN KINASE-like 2.2 n=1 Tax=Thalictrum thalictroides TaxID=46969 RepID=A0A7J6X5D9_THATH|nr:LEAF RUST 10 DISEASE-RESISTANCE LOCUS RECEPTOR-LIKE PROTEIN KINASE-like 2.2 [Thalictrum thalictroides]